MSIPLIDKSQALAGRTTAMPIFDKHLVLNTSLTPPFPAHCQQIQFAMGCFWGAERKFWQLAGVYTTAVGYSAGFTPNPSYEEVCSGLTGHTEAVLVVFDPQHITLEQLLAIFWQSHNPSQGMRQGNDIGTQYRSGIYYYAGQQAIVEASFETYQKALAQQGLPPITTEIKAASNFYYAEPFHQQYLAKNPAGYCGLSGTGVNYPG